MTNQTPVPPIEPIPTPRRKLPIPWVGIILVVLGIVFLLRQFKVNILTNWWALFILASALGILSTSWSTWQKNGRFDSSVRSTFGGGLVILTLALMFLFDLRWALYWPLMLIVFGLSMMLSNIPDKNAQPHKDLHHYASLGFWFGIAGMLLGAAFLFKNLAAYEFARLFGSFRWYGVFVILPAIGALVSSYKLYRENDHHFVLSARILLGIGLLTLVIAGFILSPLPWNVLYAVILIALGIIVMLIAWLK